MKVIKIIIPCLLLSGCLLGTSQQAKFYTQDTISAEAISTDYNTFVGVNRVQLPKYVDRPQIVTQLKDSVQINISEYNRWVEAPSVLATRVVAEDLSNFLPAAKVKMNQSKGDEFDYTVSMEIVKINAVLDDKAELVAWFTVKDKKGKTIINQKFVNTVQIGKNYDDVALGYSQLLADLSREIANVLIKEQSK